MSDQLLDTVDTVDDTVLDNTPDTTPEDKYSFVADKFKTYKEGTTDLDLDTTLSKLATSYTELEKKFSSRNILKEDKEELDLSDMDEEFLTNNKDLIELAKDSKLDKESLTKLTSLYNDKIKQVLEYKEQEEYDTTVSKLESLWGKDTDKQVQYARLAVQKLGLSEEETDLVGNSVAFIKLAAAFGSQLGEDTVSHKPTASSDIKELMLSPAYSDSKHPQHNEVKQQVSEYYNKNF